MEGWRQRRLGSKAKTLLGKEKKQKTALTLTDLLMEGVMRGGQDEDLLCI
jgi:hypothetical protein